MSLRSADLAARGPLAGIRVLDAGRFIAGPVTGTLLAEFGATVIKVERPQKGDELRQLGWQKEGKSLWWSVEGRNKLSITLDLNRTHAQKIFRRLVARSDVVIENFRAGTMERWGLGWGDLEKVNPRLIMLRTSGYGQDGPYRTMPAFNTTAESMGGLRYLIGDPEAPPARPGVALGDYVGALFGTIGVLVALYERDAARGSGRGQMIDNALYEAVMRITEYTIPAYYHLGKVRERVGAGSAGTVPARAYWTADGKWIALSAASDKFFGALCEAIGKPHLARDPRYKTNECRVENVTSLNRIIEKWASIRSSSEILERLRDLDIPATLVYSAADIMDDPHVRERGALVCAEDPELGLTVMPGVVPRLERTPGRVIHAGPRLGQHNEAVYRELLGLTEQEFASLQADDTV